MADVAPSFVNLHLPTYRKSIFSVLEAAETDGPIKTRQLQLHVPSLASDKAEDVFSELHVQTCMYTWLNIQINTAKNSAHANTNMVCLCSSP